MMPSPYQLKKAAMWPWKLYKRHRENLDPGFLRSALELHYYRPAFYRWMGAVAANPELLHEADLGPDSIVLDVGAYIGEWAAAIIARHGASVLAFEPDPRNFRQLAQRAADYPQLSAFDYGLGDRDETLPMTLQYLGSTVFAGQKRAGPGDTADVRIRDIHGAWRDLQLDRVALMKINIEGAEFPLLERMIETGLLDKVDTYVIQYHEWHPGAYSRRRRIRRALSASHRLAWDYHFVWEKWTRK